MHRALKSAEDERAEAVLRDQLRREHVRRLQVLNKNLLPPKTFNMYKLASAENHRREQPPLVKEITEESSAQDVYSYLSQNKISTKMPPTEEELMMEKHRQNMLKYAPKRDALLTGILQYHERNDMRKDAVVAPHTKPWEISTANRGDSRFSSALDCIQDLDRSRNAVFVEVPTKKGRSPTQDAHILERHIKELTKQEIASKLHHHMRSDLRIDSATIRAAVLPNRSENSSKIMTKEPIFSSSLDYIRAKRALNFNHIGLDVMPIELSEVCPPPVVYSHYNHINEKRGVNHRAEMEKREKAIHLDRRKIQDLLLLSQVDRGVLPINLLRIKHDVHQQNHSESSEFAFEFDISNYSIGDEHGICVGESLLGIHTIEALNIANNRLTSISLPTIIGNMSRLSLRLLDLSNNLLGGLGCEALATFFLQPNAIQTLLLHNCQLNNSDVSTLCKALSKFKQHLKVLNLASNMISFDGVLGLKEYLISNTCTVIELDVSGNELSTRGGKLIAEAIFDNSSIERLDVSANGITDDAGQILINNFQDNTIIQRLDLSHNKIGSRSCFVLARILRQYATLRVVNLSSNPLGEPGGRCLFREILHGSTTCEVLMQDATFDVDDTVFIYSNPEFGSPYSLDLSHPFESAILHELISIVERKPNISKFESVLYRENIRYPDINVNLITVHKLNGHVEVVNKNTNLKYYPPSVGIMKVNFAHRIILPDATMSLNADSFNTLLRIISKATTSADRNKFLRLIFQDVSCTTSQVQFFLENLKREKILRPGDIDKMDVFVAVWAKLIDSENKFRLVYSHFSKEERKTLAKLLTNEQYRFIWANATGYYNLNLSNTIQYDLMLQLAAINTVESEYGKSSQNRRCDTSQNGNWFNFRNERYNNNEFVFDTAFLYRIPRQNRICFDYVSTSRPTSVSNVKTITSEELTDMLFCLGLNRAKRLDHIELAFMLIELQLACAMYYFMTKDVMIVLEAFLLAFSNDIRVHAKVIIALFSRIWDLYNFEVILHQLPPESYNEIARRLGWLNIMNPLKPSHSFILPMKYLDNRIVIVMLLELSGYEGGEQIRMAPHTDISLVNLYGRIGRIVQITHWTETTTMTYCEFGEQTKQVAWNVRRDLVKKFLIGSHPMHVETFALIDVVYKELEKANALGLGALDLQYREFCAKNKLKQSSKDNAL